MAVKPLVFHTNKGVFGVFGDSVKADFCALTICSYVHHIPSAV